GGRGGVELRHARHALLPPPLVLLLDLPLHLLERALPRRAGRRRDADGHGAARPERERRAEGPDGEQRRGACAGQRLVGLRVAVSLLLLLLLGVRQRPLAELAEVGAALGELRAAPPLHGLALRERGRRAASRGHRRRAIAEPVQRDAHRRDVPPDHLQPVPEPGARVEQLRGV
ncbi:Os11g0241100, partial [Oryza sativa Japonica Group]